MAILGLLAAGCGGGGTPDVAATVGSDEIGADDIEKEAEAFFETAAGQKLVEDFTEAGVKKIILGFRIKHLVLDQIAERRGIHVEPGPIEEAVPILSEEFSSRAVGLSTQGIVDANRAGNLSKAIAEQLFPEVPVTDAEVEEAFTKAKAEYDEQISIEADIAIFNVKPAAEELSRRVREGEEFLEVAPTVGAIKAATVEITPQSPIPAEVVEAIDQLGVGQVSEPLATGASFYVAKVHRIEKVPARTLDEVRDEVRAEVLDQKRQALFQDWFVQQLRRVKVTVDDHYGKWNRETGNVQ
jgi:hypothetical protein